MLNYPARLLTLVEALAFSAFTAWYIWKLQFTHRQTWIVFLIWLVVSYVVHRDTPKTIGWRGDNLWPATKQAAPYFAIAVAGVFIAWLILGSLHRLPEHFIQPHRFIGYFSFCLLQQVALNSFLTNRLVYATDQHWQAFLLAGAIFGGLHWPNPVLVPLTFIAGYAMSWLFAKERNILPLTLAQAILGALVWWAFPLAWHHAMRVGPGYYTFHLQKLAH